MGEVFPKDGVGKTSTKQRKRLKTSGSRYLKPGALAQLRYTKTASGKSATHLRVPVSGAIKAGDCGLRIQIAPVVHDTAVMMSPVDLLKQSCDVRTPKTPIIGIGSSASRLESLPMDLLVKILCHLQHDQLRTVFHVSKRVRNAAMIARQFYFNYTTPVATLTAPMPMELWHFVRDGMSFLGRSPNTPKAPRRGPRPPSRLQFTEVKQVAAVLFPDSAFPKSYMVPSGLSKPLCKSMASNRVLFCEDDLCQAVVQNKLR